MKLPDRVKGPEDQGALVHQANALTTRRPVETGLARVGGTSIVSAAFDAMRTTGSNEVDEGLKQTLSLIRRETAPSGSTMHLEDLEVAAGEAAQEAKVPEKFKLGKVHDVIIVGVDTSWSTSDESDALATAATRLSGGVSKGVDKRRNDREAQTGVRYESRKTTVKFMGYGGDGVRIASDKSAVVQHSSTGDWFSRVFDGLQRCVSEFQVEDLGVGIVITIDDMPSHPDYASSLRRAAADLNKAGVVVVTLQTTGGNTSGYGGSAKVAADIQSQLECFDCHLFVDAASAGDLRNSGNIGKLVERIVDLVMEVQEEVKEEVRTGKTEEGKSARVRFNAKVKERFHGGQKAGATSALGKSAPRLPALGVGDTRRITMATGEGEGKGFIEG